MQPEVPPQAVRESGMVSKALGEVLVRVQNVAAHAAVSRPVRLVAVSKTKPVEMLQEAYDAGQRVFGENYVQELLEKAPQLPGDISWHFIGHLQSNKAKAIVKSIPNLQAVETVDSVKLANLLDKAVTEAEWQRKLNIFVQVNTSGEESKFGVDPADVLSLARHVHTECPGLTLSGLMTIGMPDYTSRPENFECLNNCRSTVAEELGIPAQDLELSMGMSGDFEQAIEMGSTNVRVGSTIFGARNYSNK
ncbi:hypothetical protein CYMTET_25979 [Cymbomonas tetramitiformis]|uniref:Pyridoxal phosphate homeostasis protein n=1 Tax=Cymbomonas tetramitiformis TaxID=36881 RepID=A0AAE0FT09_9CHLO|nr:hypothetical protein CYMTET_25979 [Cymbomonas tetramitiformis]